jgi:hypothetical protein
MTIRTFAICAALAVTAASAAHAQEAVAPGGATVSSGAAEAPRTSRRAERNVIRAADLAGGSYSDAFDVVQRLNGQWLRVRGSASFNRQEQVMVHVNNVPSGGVAALRRVQATDIAEIRHLDGTEATQRFGTGYGAGVILVTTR